jgi:acyl-CoA thioesterase-1
MSMNLYVHHRNGFPNLNGKLARKETVTVAYLGGSVTEGEGASEPDKTSWRALTDNYLKERFKGIHIVSINAGVGGTDSTFGAHRLQEHVLSKGDVDLLFVEFSINDGGDREESICGMEGIVRKCRRFSPRTDICFIYTGNDRNLTEDQPFHIRVHEEVAAYYGIPSVNFAAPIRDRIKAGMLAWEQLAPDRTHPNDAGYALYGNLLREYLETALLSEEGESGISDDGMLPPPLLERNYENAALMDFYAAIEPEGFIICEKAPDPLINWRYPSEHLYTETSGSFFSFTVSGRGAGLLLLCGPDSGIFEYSLDGTAFIPVNLFDEWCLKFYRPVIAIFPFPEERKNLRVTIRNTGGKDERSRGTSLRILALLSH